MPSFLPPITRRDLRNAALAALKVPANPSSSHEAVRLGWAELFATFADYGTAGCDLGFDHGETIALETALSARVGLAQAKTKGIDARLDFESLTATVGSSRLARIAALLNGFFISFAADKWGGWANFDLAEDRPAAAVVKLDGLRWTGSAFVRAESPARVRWSVS